MPPLLNNYLSGQPRTINGIPQNWWEIDGQNPTGGLLGGQTTFNRPSFATPTLPNVPRLPDPAEEALNNWRPGQPVPGGDPYGSGGGPADPEGDPTINAPSYTKEEMEEVGYKGFNPLSLTNPLTSLMELAKAALAGSKIAQSRFNMTDWAEPETFGLEDGGTEGVGPGQSAAETEEEANLEGFSWGGLPSDEDDEGVGGQGAGHGGQDDPDGPGGLGGEDFHHGGLVTPDGKPGLERKGILEEGEFVINKKSAGLLGPAFLNRLNRFR